MQVNEKEYVDQFKEQNWVHLEQQIASLKQGNEELLAERQH